MPRRSAVAWINKSVAVAAASLIVVAACSSSKRTPSPTTGGSSSSTSSVASGSSTTAAGPTSTTEVTLPSVSGTTTTGITPTAIHFGGVYFKAFYAGSDDGFNARLKRENDVGGVFGRTLVLGHLM